MNMVTYPITNRELLRYRKQMRRQRIIRRRVVLTILAIFLTLIFALSYNVLVTEANDDIANIKYKYFTYHEVQKGETLWSIAEEYVDYDYYDSLQNYIDELKSMNHIHDDLIKIGEEIVITYYSTEYH